MGFIRMATEDDAQAIAEIYKPYVIESAISFEQNPPTADEMKNRILNTLIKYPWIVYEDEGQVLGYAYGSTFRGRQAYSWSVETTAYVDQNHRKKGIGRKLYQDLIGRLKDQGFLILIAGVTLPNEGSVKFHEAMGFESVGIFKNLGFKQGQWWDVGFWQMNFDHPKNPTPIQPF